MIELYWKLTDASDPQLLKMKVDLAPMYADVSDAATFAHEVLAGLECLGETDGLNHRSVIKTHSV